MKIDEHLVEHIKPSDVEVDNFIDKTYHKIKFKNLNPLTIFLTKRWVMGLLLCGSIISALAIPGSVVNDIRWLWIFLPTLSIIGISVWTWALFYKKNLPKKLTNGIDMLEITRDWFSMYGVKKEAIYEIDFNVIKKHVERLKLPPKNATIVHKTPAITIETGSSKITIVEVKWSWVNNFGNYTWLRQFYVITNHSRKLKSDFELRISGIRDLVSDKYMETLENDEFNKDFRYSYNDPIETRKVLTPKIQESLVLNEKIRRVNYCINHEVLVCTSNSLLVGSAFTPLSLKLKLKQLDEHSIKNTLREELLNDFIGMTTIIAQGRQIKTLF